MPQGIEGCVRKCKLRGSNPCSLRYQEEPSKMEIRPIRNERDYKDAFQMVSGFGRVRWLALYEAEHSPLKLPESDAGRVAQGQ
jgi:hypothetical protein